MFQFVIVFCLSALDELYEMYGLTDRPPVLIKP